MPTARETGFNVMNRIVSVCALGVAGTLVLVVSARAGLAVAASGGDMSAMPVPSVLWLLSSGLFCLAAMGRRSNR